MIVIEDEKNCCGCEACASVCPQKCISMQENGEGFLYPHVEEKECIQCHLCEKTCPVIHPLASHIPQAVFAAVHMDSHIQIGSSSGGVFMALAELVIAKGGVVFGARFNKNWEVEHGYALSREELLAFQGSKYVQSRIGDSYRVAESYLKDDRWVLFSGSPCQIAGLHAYLRRSYDRLLTVDVVCHGVPSPLVWRRYLNQVVPESNIHNVKRITFRDKSNGWRNYSFCIYMESNAIDSEKPFLKEPYRKNAFMRGFLNNFYLRSSCYDCPMRNGRSGSDITLGDYLGIEKQYPEFYDEHGVSLVVIHSEKGNAWYQQCHLRQITTDYAQATISNSCLVKSVEDSPYRKIFWRFFHQKDVEYAVNRTYWLKKCPNLKRFCGKVKTKIFAK